MTLFQCGIQSCDSLRLGLTVNFLFLLLGCLVTVLMHVALSAAPDAARQRVREELRAQAVHAGYALYLVAGCAFFGAFAFSDTVSKTYVPFALSWGFLLVALLLVEFVRVRLEPPKEQLSISRKLAFPGALLFIYWVWVGADWRF